MSVDAPGRQHPLHKTVVPRPPNMVHNLVVPIFEERRGNAAGDLVERLVPAHAFPAARPAPAGAPERVEDPVGVVDLVERRRAFGTVATAAAGVQRVALELLNFQSLLIDITEQTTGALT